MTTPTRHSWRLWTAAAVLVTLWVVPTQVSYSQISVSSYSALRTLACSTGQLATIASGVLAGTFKCVSKSNALRSSSFDDGGIQFRSATSGNIWIRDFAHTASDPIDIGWYEWIKEGARVDTLVKNLAGDLGGNLYLRSPNISGVNTLNWPSWVDLSDDITGNFRFEQSSRKVVYQKLTIASSAYQDAVGFLTIDSGNNIYIGGPHPIKMEFRGHDSFAKPQHRPTTDTWVRPGLADALSFYACDENPGTFNSLTVRVDITQPLGSAIGVRNDGCSQRTAWANVTLAGHIESAFNLSKGFTNVHLDSLVYYDPYGLLYGWDGTDFPDNNDRLANYKTGGTSRIQIGGKMTGKLVMMRGGKLFFAAVNQAGNSASDPFTIEYADNCYSGANTLNPNTQIDHDGLRQDNAKMDGIGTGSYWFRIYRRADDNLGQACKDGTFNLEATIDGSTCRINENVYVEAGGLLPGYHPADPVTIDTWQGDGGITSCDRSQGHTIVGMLGRPNKGTIRMVDRITLHSGTFEDILIEKEILNKGSNNTVRDVTLTGEIAIVGGITGTTLSNITWTGSKRQVVNIGGGSNVIVPSGSKLSAPVGSTIGGTGTLTCNGKSKSLPFTFDGAADDCEGETTTVTPPPPPPPTSDTTDNQEIALSTGWNMISSFVEPSTLSVDQVLSPIIDDVVLVKDENGNLFFPEFGINTIGDWKALEAYQFNVRRNANLLVEGQTLNEDTPISLDQGWNLISFLARQAAPIEECLFSIRNELLIVKDNYGNVYNPQYGINTIGDMVPGQGYAIFVEPSATLNYSVRN